MSAQSSISEADMGHGYRSIKAAPRDKIRMSAKRTRNATPAFVCTLVLGMV